MYSLLNNSFIFFFFFLYVLYHVINTCSQIVVYTRYEYHSLILPRCLKLNASLDFGCVDTRVDVDREWKTLRWGFRIKQMHRARRGNSMEHCDPYILVLYILLQSGVQRFSNSLYLQL